MIEPVELGKVVVQPAFGEQIQSLLTGSTYTIGGKIGEGNFGIVYDGKDIWDNDLAIKVLKPNGTYDKVKKSAEGEFRKLLDLRNPYITYVYDAFEYRDTFYIITERCHLSLVDIFNLDKFDGRVWLKPIARSLLQAVHYLHLNSYAHQDIHPGNVFTAFVKDEMIPDKNQVMQFKLGDLGVAKLHHEIDGKNTLAQWMLPPEVLNSEEFGPADHRIDIYHLGLLFLQLAHSKQMTFTAQEILDGKPREFAMELPAEYSMPIERALRRHVAARTGSAMEMWNQINLIA